MDIQFQGFNPVFSTYLLGFLIIAALIFSWWSYAYLKSVPSPWRWALILFRGTALSLLILLLLNPFIEQEETHYHSPVIAVYLDDSQSMGVQREQYNGLESYQSMIENFNFGNMEDVDIRYYRFDAAVQPADSPELELDGSITNIHEVMQHIHDQSRETVAAVLFSDGIVTRGRDPEFIARELSVPLYTVPVGDTTDIRDIAITDVVTNETGYVDTRQPVEITVSQDGFPGESSTLRIIRNGEVIESEPVEFDMERSQHRVTFHLEFEEEGLHNFEAHISEMEEEATTENNRYPFSVNVIDEKTRVVHLSSEVHPDVRMFRSILARDRNIDLQTFTWIGNRFIEEEPFDADTDDIDLLVIHGEIPEQAAAGDLPAGLPVLQFLTPDVGIDSGMMFPVAVENPESWLSVHLLEAESGRNHSVLDLELPELARLPTLMLHNAEYDLPATASVLFYARHEGQETEIPVVILEEAGNTRRALVNAYGWFRYSQAEDSRTRDFTEQLISNLAAWASTNPDRDSFRISPGKQVYQEGEEIYFRADLTGETGEPETNAVIDVQITHQEENDERSYTMRHQSQGNYQLSAGSMTAGDYQYRAEARVAGSIIDTAEGEFSVTSSILEFLNTKRDDERLRSLANASGGLFLEDQQPADMISDLHDRGLMEQIEENQSLFHFLHQHIAWFIAVILLLGCEWLVRRKYSLP